LRATYTIAAAEEQQFLQAMTLWGSITRSGLARPAGWDHR
jgi:hypothetical protein